MAVRKKAKGPLADTVSKQMELGGEGFEPDACGKAALLLIDADKELQDMFLSLKEKRGQCEANVIKELKKADRDSISIDGYTISVEHIDERVKVKIKKPRMKDAE